jgi:ferric-dicitrate binding protein FerR (iron transport regulator)
MDNKEFKNLLDRYTKGLLNKQEIERLHRWLDTMEDKDAFDTLPEDELSVAKHAMFNRLTQRINHQEIKIVSIYRSRWKMAAAATIAVMIIAGFVCRASILDLIAPHRVTYASSVEGHIQKQILSDGTIVWLKGNSKLTYPATFRKEDRVVTLEGEGLFEVAKDEKRPFLVYCGTLTTKVLGTSFNIRDNGDEIAVAVLTGKVAVASDKTQQRVIYQDESIVYSETHATVIEGSPSHTIVHEFIKGTEYDMAFNDAGMEEVIQRIEKKFEVKIRMEDTAILKNHITADMTDQSLERTMEMISQALNLDVIIKGKNVQLQPKK